MYTSGASDLKAILTRYRATEYLMTIQATVNPTDPAVIDALVTLISFLGDKDERQRNEVLDLLAEEHQQNPSIYTAALLSPVLPLSAYQDLALQAFDDPSGILVGYLIASASTAHAPFWTPANKPLLTKLLTHPNKNIRLLGMRLSASKQIYHPPKPSLVTRIKEPLRKLLRR